MSYIRAMQQLLPVLYTRMIEILPNQSELSVSLQHWMLKIFFATMQVGVKKSGRETKRERQRERERDREGDRERERERQRQKE